jgi:hypothetical protein
LAAFGGAADGSCPVPGAAGDGTNQSLGYPSALGAPGTNQSSGPSSGGLPGTNQSSMPSGGGASGGGFGWMTMCGSARIRAHCAGSVGSNGFWESNGIGSPADAGARKEKGSRGGEPLWFDGSGVDVGSPPQRGGARRTVGQDRFFAVTHR